MKKYLVIFEKTATGYNAYLPDLPGCVASAATKAETEKLIYEAIQLHIEALKEDGIEIPESNSESEMMVFNLQQH